jgi:3'-phosphoadenosine 5'-phosphosulfate sulfotransferase (PAPS reductase)/FAD synthetase
MPRPAHLRKDMHQGWKELYEYWNWDLSKRVEYSHDLLHSIFKNHQKPVVCWSGGKDSTVVLHLARQCRPAIPVIYIDSGVEFPETIQFIDLLVDLWNLNTIIKRPKEGEGFWDIGSKYGWPIFGKNIASNVERAIRTGNIRPQMSLLERILAENKIHISARCSEFIQEKPSKEAEKLLGADVKIIGLRASESRARVRLWVDYGNYYFVKHYFGRNRGIWKASPIAIWTDKDIREYHKIYGIPYCELYDKGYPRNGCWPCAMGIRNGQLRRLRENHPDLFEYLITQTAMGEELLRAKIILTKSQNTPFQVKNLRLLLDLFPDFFDRM